LSWPKTDDEYETKKSSGDNLKGKGHVTLMPVYEITGTKFEDKETHPDLSCPPTRVQK